MVNQDSPSSSDDDHTGYWALVNGLMCHQNESAIFTRFSALVNYDLLVYQAELCNLHASIFPVDTKNGVVTTKTTTGEANGSATRDRSQSLPALGDYRGSGYTDNTVSSETRHTLLTASSWAELIRGGDQSAIAFHHEKVRPVLREYQDALMKASHLANVAPAQARHLNHIKEMFNSGKVTLNGTDVGVYSQPADAVSDVVSLRGETYGDPLSRWIAQTLIPGYSKFFKRVLGSTAPKGSVFDEVTSASVQRLASIISNLGTATFLIIATVVLQYLPTQITRLAMVAVFCLLYSLLLAAFQTPSISAMSALSAFAAVEVIFISSTDEVTCKISAVTTG